VLTLPVVLASASPRRKELLGHIVDNFTIAPADIDETPLINESPRELVSRLALGKAEYVARNLSGKLVIGSDTVVAINDNILGKPTDYDDFITKMELLSNNTHKVYTAICVFDTSQAKKPYLVEVLVTDVTMAEIDVNEAQSYWLTGEPKDKAGGYAIQGIGGKFVKSINGSFSAVVGLPIYETKKMIQKITE
jgi:septum formation protein